MTLAELGAAELAEVMAGYEEALGRHREVLNRLNVYPVPDGDTGTNMHLTLEAVRDELSGLADRNDMAATCKAISHGSLMGARGNSGVILCQILRGLSTTFAGAESVGPTELAKGLEEANRVARAAVVRPVEGTILTVAEAAAKAAASGAGTLVRVSEAARDAAVEALMRTPELLAVLADAGVVDAGGAGLVLLFDSLLHVVDGRALPATLPLPPEVAALVGDGKDGGRGRTGGAGATGRAGAASRPRRPPGTGEEAATGATGDDELPEPGVMGELRESAHAATDAGEENPRGLRYEVMYFLDAPDEAVPGFKHVWAGVGDSIVVVGGEGLWNCHIHTDDIGASIEAALDVGRPRDIRVTDLLEQVEEESWVRRAEKAEGPTGGGEASLGPAPFTSVVAVATGDGIRRIFHSLGVSHIVAGGQSMNPSTAELLEVVRRTPGAEVVILPNNKNIFAVAAQACELAGKPARVVDTEGIQEGFAALLDYDPEASAGENVELMKRAAGRVVAGEVTRAVRAGRSRGGAAIEAGDWIGLSREGIEIVAGTMSEAACRLLDRLVSGSHEIVTIIEGAGAKAADTRRITEWMAAHRPGTAVELHHGGQPLYPYLVAAE
jgi:dihydroxyacetone kinase-like predicted kinase